MSKVLVCSVVVITLVTSPVHAQHIGGRREAADKVELEPTDVPLQLPRQTATSVADRVGERKTRELTDGIAPMARINNRIHNRVEARLSRRIDRSYVEQTDTTTPFEVAREEVESVRQLSKPR